MVKVGAISIRTRAATHSLLRTPAASIHNIHSTVCDNTLNTSTKLILAALFRARETLIILRASRHEPSGSLSRAVRRIPELENAVLVDVGVVPVFTESVTLSTRRG
jgi:hypothetical protein